MAFTKEVQEILPQMIRWRRDLHRHPELSFEEYETTNYIIEALIDLPNLEIRRPCKTGCVAVLRGTAAETAGGLDFTPIEFLPVASMWLVSIFMYDYVGGIVIGMFVYVFISVVRALFEHNKEYVPGLPVWIMTILMSFYYVF